MKQYNNLIKKIVKEFVEQLYIEENIWEVPDETDYRIMEYNWVLQWPLELWDRYIPIDEILLQKANWFSSKSVIDYYDYSLEKLMRDEIVEVNYYNFTKENLKK